MNFLIEKAFDDALDFLSERTNSANMPQVTRLLNEAMNQYDDGELTSASAKKLVDKLVPLVKPEHQGEIQRMFSDNLSKISSFLAK